MRKIILILLLFSAGITQAQQSVSAIRGEVNTYFPTNAAKQIQAVKLRETFNDILDHVDTLNKKKYGKTIAQIRLINNTTYEMVFVLNSGKQGWFYYDSADTSTSDDNQNTIVAANGRRYKRSVLLESVTSVNGQTGVVVLTKEDILGTIETTDLANGGVTYAKIQDVSATQRVLGRNSAGAGVVQEMTLSQMLDWASSTQGSIIYRDASGWVALGPGTSGHFLQTNGAGANPAWASTSIANNSISDAMLRQSGSLSVIGRSANSTGDVADITASVDGYALRRSGTTLGFGQIATAGITDNNITDAKIRQSAGLSILGRSANTTGNIADITAGTDGHVLRLSGTTLGFGQIATAGITNNAVTVGKLQQVATGSFLGRNTAGTGDVEVLSTGTAQSLLGITGKQPNIQFQDEGANAGSSGGVSTVNFVGDGVTVSNSGGTNTVTISGGNVLMGTGTQAINTNSQTTITSVSIPAGGIITTRPCKIRIYGRYMNNTGSTATITFGMALGGTTLASNIGFTTGTSGIGGDFIADAYIIASSTTVVHGGLNITAVCTNISYSAMSQRNFNSITVPSLGSSQTYTFYVTPSTASANLWVQVDRYAIEYQ
jgi:hypothetical protein